MRSRRPNVSPSILAILAFCPAQAAAEDTEALRHFESRIRPVLAEYCYECHSADSEKKKGGLLLDTREGIRTGGDTGPAVVPGKPAESLLLTAIRQTDPDLSMPPRKDPLGDAVVADIERWIAEGAPDPREGVAKAGAGGGKDANFWALQKPIAAPLPEGLSQPDWPRRDLDHFVLARLDEAGFAPSPDADPSVLLRRVFLDLVGLPPSPEERADFLAAAGRLGLDKTLESVVADLLARPQFGERWGRHWLDVARYAESSGKESDITFPAAWRYRDYVIDAFNDDLPYPQFLLEQIAGDLLPHDSPEEEARHLIATGFLAVGPKSLSEMNRFQHLADLADEQIDAVTRVTMAQTVACARCHDHLTDPFTMEDYYALAGIFVSTKTHIGTRIGPGNNIGGSLLALPPEAGHLVTAKPIGPLRMALLRKKLDDLKKERTERLRKASKAKREGGDPSAFFSIGDAVRILFQRGNLEGELAWVDEKGRPFASAMGVQDREITVDIPLLHRGELGKPGPKVPRAFPEALRLGESTPEIPEDESGRKELVEWLVHPDHPLTARVMANRIWHHLLGAGIVDTPDHFGQRGGRPSHPQLLDHLALRFVAEGWSTKRLVREIVLSRTYRQASAHREKAFLADPENRLLWRHSKRRLDAEALRDSLLTVAGNLESTRPEGSLIAEIGDKDVSLFGFLPKVPKDLGTGRHRSVYLPILRSRLPDLLDLFDYPGGAMLTGARETTNVPLQGLYLLNSPFLREQAEGLAQRAGGSVEKAYLLALSRPPTDAEKSQAASYLKKGAAFPDLCHALLCSAEFRNVD